MSVCISNTPSPHPHASGLKLACFDIDGTIMGSSHAVSEATKRCFQFLRTQGVHVALASGRPPLGIQDLLIELPVTAPSSLFAGALLLDTDGGSSIHEAPLDSKEVTALLAVCETHGLYCELYTRHEFFCKEAKHPFSRIHSEYLGKVPKPRPDLSTLLSETIYKACLVVPAEKQESTVSTLSEAIPDCVFACSPGAAHKEIMFINVTSQLCSRTATFEALLAHLSITADEVVSFGDGETDREFLAAAGIGIAMASANQSVQSAANFITASVDEDGVHKALESIYGCSI